jgi:trehalose synthase
LPLQHVSIAPLPIQRFETVLEPEQWEDLGRTIERAGELLGGRVVWNVNSTARGGGVAEMLQSLLAYARAANVDTRWLVIEGDQSFFEVTKRIHNNLHGTEGDGGALDDEAREAYESTLARNTEELLETIASDDIVILHDPQTAGLVKPLGDAGAHVIWRAHIGVDTPNDHARGAWEFLHEYVEPAQAYIFSRKSFIWEKLVSEKTQIIPPSIDAFSPKNQEIDDDTTLAILRAAQIITEGDDDGDASPTYLREDGSPGRVDRHATVLEEAPLDFAEHVAPDSDAHLVYAGPAVEAVADDPEGKAVLEQAQDAWHELPDDVRAKVHLAALPMDDSQENAAIVNALQRRATVVVQKSLAEGFGLTVAEAMWKGRPVVASRIGGIQDQVVHGETGLLIDDANDLEAYGACVRQVLDDEERARKMGEEAQRRVREEFLGARHLTQYVELFGKLMER